jgi:putative SOS response-associated peptidase YedK
MAVVHEEDWVDWMDGGRSAESILRPFPLGSFKVSGTRVRVTEDLFGGRKLEPPGQAGKA